MEYTIVQNFKENEVKDICEFVRKNKIYATIFLTDLLLKSGYLVILNLIYSLMSFIWIPKFIFIFLFFTIAFVILFLSIMFSFDKNVPYTLIKYYVKKSDVVNISDSYFRKGNKKILFKSTEKYTSIHPEYILIYMCSNVFVLKKKLLPEGIKESINNIYPPKSIKEIIDEMDITKNDDIVK